MYDIIHKNRKYVKSEMLINHIIKNNKNNFQKWYVQLEDKLFAYNSARDASYIMYAGILQGLQSDLFIEQKIQAFCVSEHN